MNYESGTKANIFLVFVLSGLAFIIVPYFLSLQDKSAMRELQIDDTKIQVEISDDLGEQIQGLSGRASLCPDCGMLFMYDKPRILTFWMNDMRFALDIIFIRDGKIVEIYENVPPPDGTGGIPKVIKSREEADMVLEVNGGFARVHELTIGSTLDF